MNMNGKCAHPTFICNFVKTARYGSARRVHENIEATKFLHDLVDETAASCWVSDIAFQKSNSRAEGFDSRLDLMLWLDPSSRHSDDASTFTGQTERGCGSNAASPTSDETYLALQFHRPPQPSLPTLQYAQV